MSLHSNLASRNLQYTKVTNNLLKDLNVMLFKVMYVVSWPAHTKKYKTVPRKVGWYWYVVTKKHSLLGLTSA